MGVMNETVNLHIEHLVLDGVSEQERERVGQALQAELSRLLSEQGLPNGWRDGIASPMLNGGAFRVISGMSAEQKGRAIAGKIYGARSGGHRTNLPGPSAVSGEAGSADPRSSKNGQR